MSLVTNTATRSEILRYHYCQLEYQEEQIYLKIYSNNISKKKKNIVG